MPSPDLQLKPAGIAPIPTGSVYKAGQIQGNAATAKQMALIETTTGGRKRKFKKTRRRRKIGGGDAIKPQTFPPTYPVPAGSTTANQNSAAITELYAKTAANSEYDGLVGKTTNSGGSRKKQPRRRKHKTTTRRRKTKKHGGVKWTCMS